MILFVLKSQQGSGGWCGTSVSGLTNSATLVADRLQELGVATKIVTVIDGNGIDKEVHDFRPEVVILEAIWCPPYKLKELAKLWPGVRWIVRIHSEIPFLANEGQALGWLFEYKSIPNVYIASNSIRATRDLRELNTLYLPNYYPINCLKAYKAPSDCQLDIGCFGAIRPLKNQLAQAFAAIEYAKQERKHLNFYVNATRTEQGGSQPLKNIRSLFAAHPEFQLVEVPWLPWHEFLELVRMMDVCMSVSFSETFCITAANAASQDVPIVVSPEIFWASNDVKAAPTSIRDMVEKLDTALGHHRGKIIRDNLQGLAIYDEISTIKWFEIL